MQVDVEAKENELTRLQEKFTALENDTATRRDNLVAQVNDLKKLNAEVQTHLDQVCPVLYAMFVFDPMV